ncbi:LysR family transcriptional regulator [Streptomyces sp. NPDC050610]|uniref:LysR family transcriptional regulator n=1 Tax=Streptomyces sp. NPDC050610 TaxID=3157097 RepID=UPI0034230DAA
MHLDLNLLTALDALLDEGSVGAAADRLHLSQPAMSRTLSRIRRATGDEILVRAGRAMLPTPYAEEIRDEVHEIVTRAHAVLAPTAEIDPGTLVRTFTLQCNDVVADALLPRLAGPFAATAPGVCLRVLGEAVTTVDELRRGTVDLQISDEFPQHPDTRTAAVATDSLTVVARDDLPCNPSAWEGFTAVPHVVVSRRGRTHDRLDGLIERHNVRRTVAFTVPTLSLALRTVAAHDLITVAPALFGAVLLPTGLRSYPLPEPTPPIPVVLAWHARHDRDAAHRWLRDLITTTLTAMTNAPRLSDQSSAPATDGDV